tara:strand:+ start:1005 stop:1658 length:654 start_codon:yes stop_codon:yes gene_type:complete
MIIGENFVWFHLPKTAGDSTRLAVERYASETYSVEWRDPHCHFNFDDAAREKLINPREDQRVCVNFRSLVDWMHSFSAFRGIKQEYSVEDALPFMREGAVLDYEPYWANRFAQRYKRLELQIDSQGRAFYIIPCDYFLKYFIHDSQGKEFKNLNLLRVTHLEEDIRKYFSIDKDCRAALDRKLNSSSYKKTEFTPIELERIYFNNPVWASLEERLKN